MPLYRQLLLFPSLPPVGRPDPDAAAVRCRAGVEYHDLTIRDILNRNSNRRLPFTWTINPYRGCEFGCAYCYARYTHGFFDLNNWEDFETKIYVKRGAAESLKRFLKRVEAKREPIAIGTATDPYQPAEHKSRVTRSLLEVLRPLFRAAREARALDVIPNTLFLRPAARARFFPWLEEEFPELLPRYQALYGKNDYLPKAEAKRILSVFEKLHEESRLSKGG